MSVRKCAFVEHVKSVQHRVRGDEDGNALFLGVLVELVNLLGALRHHDETVRFQRCLLLRAEALHQFRVG